MQVRGLDFAVLCFATVSLLGSMPAQAQDYPNKPVTFITPAAAGNSPDVVARIVADRLTQMWNRQVVVIAGPVLEGSSRRKPRRA